MNVLVAVYSIAPAWTMPRPFLDRLRRDFPHHRFFEAWDDEILRRHLPEVDVVFSAAIERSAFASLPRLRWTPLVALFSENLRRFERGRPLLNVVDKQAGYEQLTTHDSRLLIHNR